MTSRGRARVVVHVWRCDHGHYSARCECGQESPREWDGRAPAMAWARGHVGGKHRGHVPELHVMRDQLLGGRETGGVPRPR